MTFAECLCGTIITTFACVACRECGQYQRLRSRVEDSEPERQQVYHMEIEMVPVTTEMIRIQDNLKVVVLTDNDIIN